MISSYAYDIPHAAYVRCVHAAHSIGPHIYHGACVWESACSLPSRHHRLCAASWVPAGLHWIACRTPLCAYKGLHAYAHMHTREPGCGALGTSTPQQHRLTSTAMGYALPGLCFVCWVSPAFLISRSPVRSVSATPLWLT